MVRWYEREEMTTTKYGHGLEAKKERWCKPHTIASIALTPSFFPSFLFLLFSFLLLHFLFSSLLFSSLLFSSLPSTHSTQIHQPIIPYILAFSINHPTLDFLSPESKNDFFYQDQD